MARQFRPDRPPTVLLVAEPAGRTAEYVAWLEEDCVPIVAHGVEAVRTAVTDRVDVAIIDGSFGQGALLDAIRAGAPDCSLLLLTGDTRTLDPGGTTYLPPRP